MEENKDIEQQPGTQPEDNGGSGKMFSQEEVNRIVSERLARERAKAEPSPDEVRERELTARENGVACREYIFKKHYPEQLLDIFDTSDSVQFEKSVEKLVQAFPSIGVRQTYTPVSGKIPAMPDPVRDAFGLK